MLTIGADVELIVTKDGLPVSAIPLLPGTKYAPEPIYKGALQHDGVLAEFNIDPADNEQDFILNTTTVMDQLQQALGRHGCEYVVEPHATYNKSFLDCVEAIESGCDPDYEAFHEVRNRKPDLSKTAMRTCGGHIHFGVLPHLRSIPNIRRMVLLCDLYLGVPSIYLDPKGGERRRLFGNAGCFRPKPYGFEYRTLSNFWVRDKALMSWAFRQAQKVVSELETPTMDYPDELFSGIRHLSPTNQTIKYCLRHYPVEVPTNGR